MMALYYTALIIQMKELNDDLVETVGAEIQAIRKQQMRWSKCGEDLIFLWENTVKPVMFARDQPQTLKNYIEKQENDYCCSYHEWNKYGINNPIHPGRHFLPSGQLRRSNSLCYYPVDYIVERKGDFENNRSSVPKMYAGGHELSELRGTVRGIESGWRLFRRAQPRGERAMIRDKDDPITKILEDMNFTSHEIWELELGSKKKILKHKKRIYDHLLSLE
jgi:hypothetical protein